MDIGIKKAFILAGGEGTRLRPVTYEIAKPLIPVCGKPVLQWNIELCKKFGVKEIVLALGYKADQVKAHFEKNPVDGIKFHYNVEKEFLGTAGALKFAESYFESEKKFIMMNADDLKQVDYQAVNKAHEKNNAVATIALKRLDDVSQYGVVRLDGEKILEFVEKPAPGTEPSKLINSGAYLLSNKIFDFIPQGKVSIERDTFPKIAAAGKLFGSETVGNWHSIDTFERWEKAIFGWKGLQ